MVTGGSGYTAPPAVSLSGGGGNGAVLLSHMAGTMVDSVVIVNGGTGYTSAPTVTIAGNASATASIYSGALIPATFVRSRFNDLYVFDGMGRGLRWEGSAGTMQPIGVQKPQRGPTVTVTNASMSGYIDGVAVVATGQGYSTAPTVTLSGGSPTKAAVLQAEVSGGRVVGVTVSDAGAGYQSVPQINIATSPANGAAMSVGVIGSVNGAIVRSGGSNYTSAPTVTFANTQGLTGANALASINENGQVVGVEILSPGTGATGPVTITLTGGGGAGAVIDTVMNYRVNAVTVSAGGTGFLTPPAITFRPDATDTSGNGAVATATVASGAISAVTVTAGGSYTLPPTVYLGDYNATATATLSNTFRGTYKCAIRYIDATTKQNQGPICSSISDLVEVKVPDGASQLTWTLSHAGLDDRVHAAELWRTTADQSVLLFKVATIKRTDANWSGTYVDSIPDAILSDSTRDGYSLLPVTLPSGQINARRFGVPPGNFSVACMFQDRCWLAVDTTGRKPNTLYYSEIDEPESIPLENEMVIQENAGDSDALVALIPLGSFLLCAQSRHLYKMSYVAQPVLDASIMLVGYRGIINSRCWDVMGGVAYIADSFGVYAHDGQNEEPISLPVDYPWRAGQIDWSQSSKFFVRCDKVNKVVRFFHCQYDNAEPRHVLCYSTSTKTWWSEQYAIPLTASAPYALSGQQSVAYGTSGGSFVSMSGYSDNGQPVAYSLKTGNLSVVNEDGRRGVTLIYTPTTGDAPLALSQFYNGSSTARANAIASDRGDGFVASAGTQTVLNMKLARSTLGDSTGVARAMFSGGNDERSAGADRHVAIQCAGTQSSTANAPVFHSIIIEGAQ
jgi:hypothetical protein